MIKVLVVDDSALMRRLLGNVFRAQDDMEVAFARDGLEAMKRLHAFQPDVVTLDIHMPHLDGLACLDRIMIERPSRVVMVSSLTEAGADATLEAMQLGAIDFIAKPTGAISLAMDELGAELVGTVRSAARARLRPTLRLADRVRLRANGGATISAKPAPRWSRPSVASPAKVRTAPAAGDSTKRVVLVGASTGGPPALDALLAPLPGDFPWPVVIAQHMPASFTGPLSRRLDKLCALDVTEVKSPPPLAAGRVYIAKGDADIIVSMWPSGPVVMPAPASAEHRWHPSVDRMVASAIAHLEPASLIGVLMTGMGNDGAASMTRLSADGGLTIAEAEETAVVWGMPGELVRAGGAQVVAPLHRIAKQLLDWAS